MMGDSHHEARSVFTAALALNTPEEQARYLEEACRDKPGLRRRIEALLQAHAQAGGFLEQTAPVALLPDLEVERTGVRIGRYKLLEQIGEGGFGVVYMAEQKEPVHRKVALKIIKAGMDTKDVVARFEAERQALALMDHPNIARVFDGGVTQAGRPYFVMELVQGISITGFCDRRNLDTTRRLQLFIQVCHAVQHAHQKGIIHRDLKPSNILVTLVDGNPVPKVIDFGVAKALGQPLTDKTLFTGFLRMVGTPAYMSPEQAELSGMDMDTRADIYALGVLLYELLTGVTPFDSETMREAALDEIRRMIRETDPPKPSTRLQMLGEELTDVAKHRQSEPAALSRLMRGDLDWVVMKCLEKDRTRRYRTAADLGGDVQRHLEHRPVSAGPPSAAYRLRKFARRRRGELITAGTITAVITAAVAVGWWQSVRTREAVRRTASKEAEVQFALGASGALPSDVEARQLITGVASVEPEAALSPDETMLAFVEYDGPDWDLWVLDLATGERRNLTQSEKHRPGVFQQCPGVFVWSPDSRRLAYVWFDELQAPSLRLIAVDRSFPAVSFEATNRIYSVEIDVSGSRPRTLFAAPPNTTYYVPEAWTHDGRRLLCRRHRPDGVALVDVDTGAVRALPVKRPLRHPRLSPDDRYVVFSHSNEVHLLEIDTGRQTRLTFGGGTQPIWAPNDPVVLFSGRWGLSGVRIEDAQPVSEPFPVRYGIGGCDKRLTESGRLIVHRQLAPGDGYTIAEGAPVEDRSVLNPFPGRIYLKMDRWLYTLTSEAGRAVVQPVGDYGQPSRALHGGQRWFLQLKEPSSTNTPSGHPRNELFAVAPGDAGGRMVRLTGDPHKTLQPDLHWATDYTRGLVDGRVSWRALPIDDHAGVQPAGIYSAQVAFDATGHVTGLVHSSIEPLVADAGILAEMGTPSHDWSPDGTHVVYAAGPCQSPQLHILDVRIRQSRRLTMGIAPVWSPDGSVIAFRRGHDAIFTIQPDGSGLQAVAERAPHPGIEYGYPIPGYYELVWSPDSSALLYGLLESVGGGRDFYCIARNGGEPDNFTRGVLGSAIPVAWLPEGGM